MLKLKEGDIVEVFNPTNEHSCKMSGEIGRVVEFYHQDKDCGRYCVLDIEKDYGSNGIWNDEVRLATGLQRQKFLSEERRKLCQSLK